MGAYDSKSESQQESGGKGFTPELKSRLQLCFDRDWLFYRPIQDAVKTSANAAFPPTSTNWETVALPHSVRLEPLDVSGGQNYQGLCWYQKHFQADAGWKNRTLYLKFEGAMQVADVWLNGKHLTTHYGGFTPFTVDISDAVAYGGNNILSVRLDNTNNAEVPPGKPQNGLDFIYFGGLYRSVQLEVADRLHITDPILANKAAGGGIFVTFPDVNADKSTIVVQTDVINESSAARKCTVRHQLIGDDPDKIVSCEQSLIIPPGQSRAVTQSMQVLGAKLWHPEHPNLYWLHTIVSENGHTTDDQLTRIGIRRFRFDKDRGLLINDQPFFSIGANRHQEHPYVGYALPASAHYRDAFKLRAAGFTSYRSHYPQDSAFMDACDELGIIGIVSNPGWQFMGDDLFKHRVYQDAREMVRRDRNRPSVAIWEAALNESDNSSIATELYRIIHEEFPGPNVYTGGDPIHKPVEGFSGWDIKYTGYRDNDRSRPAWIREWGDEVDNWSDQQGRVRCARVWGESPMLVQAASHLRSLDRIYSSANRPAGACVWAGIDYSRGYHHQPFLGSPLDLFRLPKFDYFMFQSQRPPEVLSGAIGSGPMIFIANYASFQSPEAVTVFSNCEQVRLYQNGKLIATQEPDSGYRVPHPPFTFKVGEFSNTVSMLYATGVAPIETEVGELKVEGLIGGKVAATHRIFSPGVPESLQLELDACNRPVIADGADWVRVYAHICDARNTTYPYANDRVMFSVRGQGALIGDASTAANPVRTEAGIATALVRTTAVAGTIVVSASAPGLKPAYMKFESQVDRRVMLGSALNRGND